VGEITCRGREQTFSNFQIGSLIPSVSPEERKKRKKKANITKNPKKTLNENFIQIKLRCGSRGVQSNLFYA
jgi:hypothetical protein